MAEIPLLGIYLDKIIIWKDTCTSMITAALFTIVKTWKQPECPSTDEWIKKMWYIYTMEYYSAIKKNENNTIYSNMMVLEIIILSEVSQTKTNTIWYQLYVDSDIWHKWTYLWNRNRLTGIENRLVVAKGEGHQGGMDWEFGISRCKLVYIGWISNKVLLYSTGNYIQSPGINHNGKEYFFKKEHLCV